MNTKRLTMAQALIEFLSQQYVARDGVEQRFFAGVWGIFGHGNVAGIGQALEQYKDRLTFHQSRNEQAQVHAAVAYAKHKNRLQTFACTSSIGPGATNMITGAAVATVNRIPVLLLPGDIFAERIKRLCCSRSKMNIRRISASMTASSPSAVIGIGSIARSRSSVRCRRCEC
ncbi:MAG: thiamine pyrophosphate-binding protein [Anaerolineae bacterium]